MYGSARLLNSISVARRAHYLSRLIVPPTRSAIYGRRSALCARIIYTRDTQLSWGVCRVSHLHYNRELELELCLGFEDCATWCGFDLFPCCIILFFFQRGKRFDQVIKPCAIYTEYISVYCRFLVYTDPQIFEVITTDYYYWGMLDDKWIIKN